MEAGDKEKGERDDVPYYTDEDETTIVECETTAGPFAMQLRKEWSPNGYERAIELFRRGFYDHSHFFRVVPNFLVQFGISYTKDHELQTFAKKTIKDDPPFYPKIEFEEGMISFAGSGKDSRSSHLFVAYGKNPGLGTQLWETPIGTVIRGMETLKTLNHEYGDMPPWGKGPVQHDINTGGNEYIEKEFPHLDKFLMCHVIEHEIAETNDEEEKEVDDGGKDDLLQIDVHKLRETVHKQQLLRKSSEQINDTTSNHGFEVPLFVFFAVVVIILFGIKKRNKNKLSKSL